MRVSVQVAKSAIQQDTRTHGSGCSISADLGVGTQVDTHGYTHAIPYLPYTSATPINLFQQYGFLDVQWTLGVSGGNVHNMENVDTAQRALHK